MKSLGHVSGKYVRYWNITKKTANIVKKHVSIENRQHKHELARLISEIKPVNWPKKSQFDEYYINEDGMCKLLVGSQQPLAKELAEYMDIKIIGYKYVRKEAGTSYTIQKVFEGISKTTV